MACKRPDLTKRKSFSTYQFSIYSVVLVTVLLLALFSNPALATTSIGVGPVDTPNGAVILIVDGMGATYIYPELTPHSIDGTILDKADVQNISTISKSSSRILNVEAQNPYTEAGHSTIATGYSQAEAEMVGYSGSTIYDSARAEGFVSIAILEKGDSYQMRGEQDIVIYDETNSINSPTMSIDVNSYGTDTQSVEELMQASSSRIYEMVEEHPEGSKERYDAYNSWTIETAIKIIGHMEENYPDQKYILTINAGAIDTSGHYRGSDGYIENIEGVDASIMPLYEACLENDLAFIATADHGMGFAYKDARGGHQSEKYSSLPEARMVPLIINSKDTETGVFEGNFGQEDIAPTILSVLNIPNGMKFADSEAIPVKSYANIQVSLPEKNNVELIRENVVLASGSNDREYLFLGVKPGYSYTVRMMDGDLSEQEIFVDSDVKVEFATEEQTEETGFFQNRRHLIGVVLIVLINLAGLLLIVKIYRE